MVNFLDLIANWLQRDPDNHKIQISHGGKGGKYYVLVTEAEGESVGDGVGDTLEEAVIDAMTSSGVRAWIESHR